jgi:hypothetical protein
MKIYEFNDGCYNFYTAIYGSWANDKIVLFRVKVGVDPKLRAEQKEIKYYDRLIILDKYDEIKQKIWVEKWLESHPGYNFRLIKIIN